MVEYKQNSFFFSFFSCFIFPCWFIQHLFPLFHNNCTKCESSARETLGKCFSTFITYLLNCVMRENIPWVYSLMSYGPWKHTLGIFSRGVEMLLLHGPEFWKRILGLGTGWIPHPWDWQCKQSFSSSHWKFQSDKVLKFILRNFWTIVGTLNHK